MKKYLTFFRMKFMTKLSYRGAAIAGMTTQFVWGTMEILVYKAFYQGNEAAFPMTLQATASYIWLQQAFLAFFMAFFMENELLNMITQGDIAYELCRPINIYDLWLARSLAHRLASGLMRCVPIIIVALIVPKPYGLSITTEPVTILLFLCSLILGILVVVLMCMIVYMMAFFTISAQGLKMCFFSMYELLAGSVVPLPFFPEKLYRIASILPTGSTQNVPLRIYSGDLCGMQAVTSILLQIFWILVLWAAGKLICHAAMKKVTVLGG